MCGTLHNPLAAYFTDCGRLQSPSASSQARLPWIGTNSSGWVDLIVYTKDVLSRISPLLPFWVVVPLYLGSRAVADVACSQAETFVTVVNENIAKLFSRMSREGWSVRRLWMALLNGIRFQWQPFLCGKRAPPGTSCP